MTIKARNRTIAAAAVVAAIAVAATLLPMIASSELDPDREVRLVIRDMAYYLDGTGEANPTLRFRSGERVRVILTNEDAGMTHDFVVQNWKVGTDGIDGRGQDTVDIDVPRGPGIESYVCTPHSAKMRGTIVVE